MKAILCLCAAVLLAGCRGEQAPKPEPTAKPKVDLSNPVTGPIGIGEQLKADLRKTNAGQQARRTQIEDVFEKK